MSGHTPGPWEVGEDIGVARRCIVTKESRDICRCETYYGDDEANARLIASAPELLEVLRDMVAVVGSLHTHDNVVRELTRCGAASTLAATYTLSRAAVAKAEGKEV